MEKFAGKSIFRKVAIGKIFFYEKKHGSGKENEDRGCEDGAGSF